MFVRLLFLIFDHYIAKFFESKRLQVFIFIIVVRVLLKTRILSLSLFFWKGLKLLNELCKQRLLNVFYLERLGTRTQERILLKFIDTPYSVDTNSLLSGCSPFFQQHLILFEAFHKLGHTKCNSFTDGMPFLP